MIQMRQVSASRLIIIPKFAPVKFSTFHWLLGSWKMKIPFKEANKCIFFMQIFFSILLPNTQKAKILKEIKFHAFKTFFSFFPYIPYIYGNIFWWFYTKNAISRRNEDGIIIKNVFFVQTFRYMKKEEAFYGDTTFHNI